MRGYRNTLCASLVLVASLATATAQRPRPGGFAPAIPADTLLRIIRAEDERRWNDDLKSLLANKDAQIRQRAALAAGRIGDERAVAALVELLRRDSDRDVRQMAAFALGEIESPAGADALIEVLGYGTARYGTARYGTARGSERVNATSDSDGAVARPSGRAPEISSVGASNEVRARALEGLGKISAALPESEKDRKRAYGEAILDALKFEAGRRSLPDRASILLGLAAALRAKPEGVGPVITRFLANQDARIRADVFNTLARLRLKDGNSEARDLLIKDSDPIVRANAARVLGATEDKAAFEALLDRALHDEDLRVRVSAIRALGNLKDVRAASPLLERVTPLFAGYRSKRSVQPGRPQELNELLEIANTLGRVLSNANDQSALNWLRRIRVNEYFASPEFEIAFARISTGEYVQQTPYDALDKPLNRSSVLTDWPTISGLAQGLGEIANSKNGQSVAVRGKALGFLAAWLNSLDMPIFAVPTVIQAYASFKPANLDELLRKELSAGDVIVRSTAAELLGGLAGGDGNTRALDDALKSELPKVEKGEMNDAALAILEALAKQKSAAANDAIKTALDSTDHLIRRKAVALLKANGTGDFSNRVGTVKTRNTEADYRRAIARIGKEVTATVETSKGSFTIEFLPEDAPLTVDNFIQLARKGFFNGQTIPRVVPNFVIQAGDPRGDTNGGPGYQIRCEINEVPYERGAVGMALSGKDTGGSQWFVTHSPQPHLDGGYTVFGRVVAGMEVVDNIARGDIIRRVTVSER